MLLAPGRPLLLAVVGVRLSVRSVMVVLRRRGCSYRGHMVMVVMGRVGRVMLVMRRVVVEVGRGLSVC